jgi:hypothetical protein
MALSLVVDLPISKPSTGWHARERALRLYLTAAIAPLCAMAGLLTWTSASASAQNGPAANTNVATFGTQTATATKPDGRGIYSFAATPGGQVEDHVAVFNYSRQTITLQLRGTDAVNTPQGGFAARPVNQRSTGLGTWVALPASALTVTLPPRSNLIVPFLVEVPKNATPGDHAGVLTATLQSSIISKSGQRVRLLQTIGSRIFLRVSGPLHPGFSVTNLHVSYQGTLNPVGTGRADLSYTVRNTGNVALGGHQTVYISGLFGSKKVAAHVAQVQLLLPGFSITQHVPVSGIIPELHDTAHVSITPLYIPGSVQPASGPYQATLSFWAIPWTLIGIIVLLILLLVALWLIRRRRRRTPPGKGGDVPPGPDAAAVDDATGGPAEPAVPAGEEGRSIKEPAPVGSDDREGT